MCTRNHVRIKGVSIYSQEHAFVPCGECEECRAVQRNSWAFRLRVELEKLVKRGWWLGFITLTFNDEHLPHIPRVLLGDGVRLDKMPMSFDKRLARDFITRFRQWLTRDYDCVKRFRQVNKVRVMVKDDSVRYMFCSEYGENTHRCHHHFLMALPSYVPPRKVFEWIHENWGNGFCFPKDFNGGMDSYLYEHKPFVVDSVASACSYCAKYVCKDLAYFESFRRADFKKEVTIEPNQFVQNTEPEKVRLSDYMPFHLQSRSLGNSFIADLSDAQKIEYLNKGVSLVGAEKLARLPKYLEKKLLFQVYYPKDKDGKRLVRYFPTAFFSQHYEKIFNKKARDLAKKITELRDIPTSTLLGLNPDFARLADSIGKMPVQRLAEYYLAYGGVNYFSCIASVPPARMWFARYEVEDDGDYVTEVAFDDASLLDVDFWRDLNAYVTTLYFAQNIIDEPLEKRRVELRRRLDFYHDLYTSQE